MLITVLILFCISFSNILASNPIVESARKQIGVTLTYDPSYKSLDFPNGDVDLATGVCTDVVIRALRDACKFDLQSKVNYDMKYNFSKYPKIWGLKRTDKNIDHRRVPNLITYFKRQGFNVPVTKKGVDYKAGDLVTCIVPPNLAHIMIVSDKVSAKGNPLIIHNIGYGTKEEARLFEFKLTGHFRLKICEPKK